MAALLEKFFAEEAAEREHAESPWAEELRRKFAAKTPGATDSALHLALDQQSTRSFDTDGRMHISVANISKANICPYKGSEIPGSEELGLEPDKVYQLLRAPEELEKGAATFNGIQLLKKHVPVDANDHQMWDIVGTTGSDAMFDGMYLKNSLHIWTKEGVDFIESGDQRELSCGYHYVPLMTPGIFGGKRYDGVMTQIEGNHVALVEEGRAGHDVVVGDSALVLEKDDDMPKPTRLEYLALTRCARAINPMLATDAKVEYGPIFRGLTSKNFSQRKPAILDGLKKAIKGKTIAQDASLEHVANFLNTFEHEPPSHKSWAPDESVSGAQHRAMEAAAHGHSNLGIPEHVGKEFERADKGKTFGDMIRDWAMSKDWGGGGGMSDDDFAALDRMHMDAAENLIADQKEGENVEIEVEEGEDQLENLGSHAQDRRKAKDRKARDAKRAKDKKAKDAVEQEEEEADDEAGEEIGKVHEEGEADDEVEQEEEEADDSRRADDRRHGKDRKAKDRRAMDSSKYVTVDEMNKAVAAVQQRAKEAAEARQFVEPYVGKVSLAMDSAEGILRAAAKALSIEDADKVHHSALKTLIKTVGGSMQRDRLAQDDREHQLALDAGSGDMDSFNKMFPGAARIQTM